MSRFLLFFLIQNVKEQSPPLSLRAISPRGERD